MRQKPVACPPRVDIPSSVLFAANFSWWLAKAYTSNPLCPPSPEARGAEGECKGVLIWTRRPQSRALVGCQKAVMGIRFD